MIETISKRKEDTQIMPVVIVDDGGGLLRLWHAFMRWFH